MKNILIIENDLFFSQDLNYFIKTEKDPVRIIKTVFSVEEAISILQEFKPGLVIINLEMPHAYKFIVLNDKAAFPIIVTISNTPENLIGVRLSRFDYLVRPLNPTALHNLMLRYGIVTDITKKQPCTNDCIMTP